MQPGAAGRFRGHELHELGQFLGDAQAHRFSLGVQIGARQGPADEETPARAIEEPIANTLPDQSRRL